MSQDSLVQPDSSSEHSPAKKEAVPDYTNFIKKIAINSGHNVSTFYSLDAPNLAQNHFKPSEEVVKKV